MKTSDLIQNLRNRARWDTATSEYEPEDHTFWQTADRMESMREAMQEFVDRCEKREVLSIYTYAKFKDILSEDGE